VSESGCGDTEVGAAACGVLPGAVERGGGWGVRVAWAAAAWFPFCRTTDVPTRRRTRSTTTRTVSESGCGDTEVGAAACGVLPGAVERGGGRVLLGRRRVTHLSAQEHQTFTNLRTE